MAAGCILQGELVLFSIQILTWTPASGGKMTSKFPLIPGTLGGWESNTSRIAEPKISLEPKYEDFQFEGHPMNHKSLISSALPLIQFSTSGGRFVFTVTGMEVPE